MLQQHVLYFILIIVRYFCVHYIFQTNQIFRNLSLNGVIFYTLIRNKQIFGFLVGAAFLLSVQFNGSIGKIAWKQPNNAIANNIEFYSWVKCPLGFCGKQNRNKSCGYPFGSSVFISICFSKHLSLLCSRHLWEPIKIYSECLKHLDNCM